MGMSEIRSAGWMRGSWPRTVPEEVLVSALDLEEGVAAIDEERGRREEGYRGERAIG